MTTTVKVSVNGRYRALVTQDDRGPFEVLGNGVEGQTGEQTFYLAHPCDSAFRVTEAYIADDDPVLAPKGDALDVDEDGSDGA